MKTETVQLEVGQIGNTTIHVNDEGRFFAEIDGKTVYRASRRSLERLVEQRMSPLHVIIPKREWDWRITEDRIIRVAGENLKSEKSSYGRYERIYMYNEEAVAKLRELLAEYQELCNRWDAVLKKLFRVTPKNLESLRKDAEAH